MTLDEAIKHAQWVADTNCDQCAEDHQQLAEWLKELKELRTLGWHHANELPEEGDECVVILENGNIHRYTFSSISVFDNEWHYCGHEDEHQRIKQWCYE